MAINWNKYREVDGKIDIEKIFKDEIFPSQQQSIEYVEAIGFIK